MSMNMKQQNQDIEFGHNIVYRDKYHKTLSGLLFMILVAAALSVILAFINMEQKKASFYATTSAGLVIPLHSLAEPIVTNAYLVQWVSLATRKSLNLDFLHYEEQLDQARGYFTPGGWQKFQGALDKSGLLKTVQDKKLMMNAVVSDTAVILNQAILHGRFTWRIQLPLLVTYGSASQQYKTKLLVTMNVQRVSTLDTSEGIQISDFVSELQ